MKINIITKGLAGLVAVGVLSTTLTSCKDDYLDLAPITDISTNTVTSTMVGAQAAMVGLCNGMYRYCDFGINDPCGEPYLIGFYGDAMGNASLKSLELYYEWRFVNWTYMNNPAASYGTNMWRYAYNLIDNANNILAVIDNVEASEDEVADRNNIKAVALTIRAHAYIRLLQMYAPRWEDSNNGNTYCLILRTEPATVDNVDKDFSTMSQVLGQVYGDLNEAISIWKEIGDMRGSNIWMPNIDVAYGLYARAAMIQNDYDEAIAKATLAMANHPIMSADQYRSGFIYANSEYLWATDLEVVAVGQRAWGNFFGTNGNYTARFDCPDSIDYTLYQQLSMTDCRKLLYFTPELIELTPVLADAFDITPEDFFLPYTKGGIIYPTGYDILCLDPQYKAVNYALTYAWGDYPEYGSALVTYDSDLTEPDTYYNIRFGQGFKFWGIGNYCYNNFPFMRASEMGYIVAEAQYMLGNTTEAQEMMNYLNKDVRDPEYDCTLTGDDLLDHIKAYREIELWDEGFSWFDLKRWGDPCVRKAWVEGDPNSGNWGPEVKSFDPSFNAGWRYSVPESEFLYNKGADPMKVMY
ncbi:MAG: RagB/SusD family nutrient uptake outer membrane protein [Muribaculaceae bacterium]|nr:RagB/SusD family nutrient uptake outer membrane protein [Muribaculaceae bacterium]